MRLGLFAAAIATVIAVVGAIVFRGEWLRHLFNRAMPRIWDDLVVYTIANPIFYAAAAVILILERLWPARAGSQVLL